jgi:hypothetical protein
MGEKMKRLRPRGVVSVAGVLAATALLTAAPAAFAQQIGPTDDQYDSALEVISQGERSEPPSGQPGGGDAGEEPAAPTASADRPVGGLPFTGTELIGLLAVAVVLTGAGLVTWRVARERSTDTVGSS